MTVKTIKSDSIKQYKQLNIKMKTDSTSPYTSVYKPHPY